MSLNFNHSNTLMGSDMTSSKVSMEQQHDSDWIAFLNSDINDSPNQGCSRHQSITCHHCSL